MSKVTTIFISILLILAAAIIHYFVEVTATRVDEEWIGFFSVMCFGTGTVLPLTLLKKKKNT